MVADSKAWGLRSGWHAAAPATRIYLTGEVCIEADDRLLRERRLPGPQARHLLAFLAAERGSPTTRECPSALLAQAG